MEISVDFDNTLSQTVRATLEYYAYKTGNIIEYEDVTSYTFTGMEISHDAYLEHAAELWEEEPKFIQPKEAWLHEYLYKLDKKHEVDIVTSRCHCREQMEEWLDCHNITHYRDFICTEQDKADLGYDVYVDDSPDMAGRVDRLFMVLHPYNRHLTQESGVTPIHSIDTVVQELC